jgi:omega-hydroxy-beta-dihydromenaquinone-9 sulfotransferase
MRNKEVRRRFSFLITVLAGGSVSHLIHLLSSHSLDFKYAGRVVGTVIVSCILEPFRWWEELLWKRKIRKVNISTPPVFIIGFWRSGTTLLHNLLCQAPGTTYISTYQTVFPNLLSHSWWFKPIIGKFWPTHRPFDDVKMGMDLPQEEEIGLNNVQDVSFYNFLCFPKDFERFYTHELFMKDLDDKHIAKWKYEYVKMIRKAVLSRKGDRFISKSPSNMARIKQLLEMFPDARFIFLYRDPYKTVESFYRFFHEVMPTIQVQESNEELTRERLTRVYADMVRAYFLDMSKIPPQNLMEIKFELFTKNPVEGLRKIFDQFGIPGFEDSSQYFENYLVEMAGFTSNKYEINDETIRYVNEYAGDIVDRLDYPRKG